MPPLVIWPQLDRPLHLETSTPGRWFTGKTSEFDYAWPRRRAGARNSSASSLRAGLSVRPWPRLRGGKSPHWPGSHGPAAEDETKSRRAGKARGQAGKTLDSRLERDGRDAVQAVVLTQREQVLGFGREGVYV